MMKNKSLWTSLFNQAGQTGDRSNWKFGWSPKSPLRAAEGDSVRRSGQERPIVAGYGLLIQRHRSPW